MPALPNPIELLEELKHRSALIDHSTAIEPFGPGATMGPSGPADATSKFVVQLEPGERGFLTVSGVGNPDLVARATRNITAIRSKLSNRYAEPVIEPLETGVVQGFSFAIWPMLAQFPDGHLTRYLTKRRLSPGVLNWLHGMCAETQMHATAQERDQIAANLVLLHDDQRHPGNVRRAAADAAGRVTAGQWGPVRCVQHSDLWLGNVMLSPRGSAWPFSVIDWGGATVCGFPFFDLCRFAISSNVPARLVQEYVQRQLDQSDFDRADIVSYVLCALGQIQANLEYFPEELFREMVVETTRYAFGLAGNAS